MSANLSAQESQSDRCSFIAGEASPAPAATSSIKSLISSHFIFHFLYTNSFSCSRSVSYARNNKDFVADSLSFKTSAICLIIHLLIFVHQHRRYVAAQAALAPLARIAAIRSRRSMFCSTVGELSATSIVVPVSSSGSSRLAILSGRSLARIARVIHRQVGCNPIQPRRELRACLVAGARPVYPKKHFLRQVFGCRRIMRHADT